MSRPTFSIVIPACDEEQYLPGCLVAIEAARKQLGEPVEVIIADNMSRDRTRPIAEAFGAKVVPVHEKCLSVVRNRGAAAATGKYLAFIDADSLMSPNMLVAVKRAMDSGKWIGGGIVNCRPDRMSLGIFLSLLVLGVVWLRDRVAVVLFFTTPEAFNAIGGFDPDLFAIEDLDFGRRLKRLGKTRRLRYRNLYRGRVTTSARKFDEFGDWFFFRHPGKILRAFRNDRDVAHEFWYKPRR